MDLTCGAGNGFFGPEVVIAEVLSKAYPDETVFILKYTMSGYSLHYHWLCADERGSIYEAFLTFSETYLNLLHEKNYEPKIGAICWMHTQKTEASILSMRVFPTVRTVSLPIPQSTKRKKNFPKIRN